MTGAMKGKVFKIFLFVLCVVLGECRDVLVKKKGAYHYTMFIIIRFRNEEIDTVSASLTVPFHPCLGNLFDCVFVLDM